MFYLTTHSTHFIYGYIASDIWLRTILIVRKETRCRHIGYSFRLAARVLLHASSHRQDNTYHGLCTTSRGALAGTRNSSMGPPHEGSIRWPIAPWAKALTTELFNSWRDREMFYLTTHSTHFIYGYMASNIWLRTILIVRKETRCCHIGYSYRLTARVLLYTPSHQLLVVTKKHFTNRGYYICVYHRRCLRHKYLDYHNNRAREIC